MGQHPELDLGIIRIHEYIAFFRDKNLPDQSAKFHPYRNILQVRLRAAEPPGSGHRLMKLPVDPPVRPDKVGKAVRVSGLQLGKLPVFQDLRHQRIIRGQLVQHLRRRRVPGLGLLGVGHFQFLKQDHTQLFG